MSQQLRNMEKIMQISKKIQELFCYEKRNDKILNKIFNKNYSIDDIVVAILNASNKYSTLCIKLAHTFKYSITEWTHDLLESLFRILLEICADIFLQYCCFQHIFDFGNVLSICKHC